MSTKFFSILLFVVLAVVEFQASAQPGASETRQAARQNYRPLSRAEVHAFDERYRSYIGHTNRYRAESQRLTTPMPRISGDPNTQQQNLANSSTVGDPVALPSGVRGVTESYQIRLETGELALWKPQQMDRFPSNSRAEVLAFELSRRFGFDLVPETVMREINGVPGTVQLWMEGTREGLATIAETEGPFVPQREYLDRQSVFDFLIENHDRHLRNWLVTEDGRVYSIDHGMSFTGRIGGARRSLSTRLDSIRRFLETDEGREIAGRIQSSLQDSNFRAQVVAALGQSDADLFFERANILLRAPETDPRFDLPTAPVRPTDGIQEHLDSTPTRPTDSTPTRPTDSTPTRPTVGVNGAETSTGRGTPGRSLSGLSEAEFNSLSTETRRDMLRATENAFVNELARLEFAELTPENISRMAAVRNVLAIAAREEVLLYLAYEGGTRLGLEIYERNADSDGFIRAGDIFGRVVDEVIASSDAYYHNRLADNAGFADIADLTFSHTVDIYETALADNRGVIMAVDAIGAAAETIMSVVDGIADAIHPQFAPPLVDDRVVFFLQPDGSFLAENGERYDRDGNFTDRNGVTWNNRPYPGHGARPSEIGPHNPYDETLTFTAVRRPDGTIETDENGTEIYSANETVLSVGQRCTVNCLEEGAPLDADEIAYEAAQELEFLLAEVEANEDDGFIETLPATNTSGSPLSLLEPVASAVSCFITNSCPEDAGLSVQNASHFPRVSSMLTPAEFAELNFEEGQRLEAFLNAIGAEGVMTQEEFELLAADLNRSVRNEQILDRLFNEARSFIASNRPRGSMPQDGAQFNNDGGLFVGSVEALFNEFDVNESTGAAGREQRLQQILADQQQERLGQR